jgi:predicted DNA-binding protein (MmcQ/YjbR family)
MNIEEFRNYCMSKKGVSEEFPFDNNTLVFKVMNKIFALTDVNNFGGINLKCEPLKAVDLRENFFGITPGYHMNKKHWNTISMNSDVDDRIIVELIDHSYALVASSLPKKTQLLLADL